MNEPILHALNVRKTYQLGRTTLPVLRGVNLSVQPGEFVAIMGSSGSGKSTLLHVLGALDVPQSGQVLFRGVPIFPPENERGFATEDAASPGALPAAPAPAHPRLDARANDLRNRAFGFVFQFYHLLPEYNVLENVLLPQMVAAPARDWFAHRDALERRARHTIDSLGLAARILHHPNELSGGERQRAAIARALVNDPAVLLADEPTGNLDASTGREILATLKRLNESGQTIIMVTHDPEVAAFTHRIVRLADGRLT